MKLSALVLLLISCNLQISAHGAEAAETQVSRRSPQHERWLLDRLREAISVTAGTSLSDLLKVFETGLGRERIAKMYRLKSCPLIKIDVEFDFPPNPGPLKHSMIKVKTVSRPYLSYD